MNAVSLSGAKVKGQLLMPGASFDELMNAAALEVDGNFLISSLPQNKTTFKKGMILIGARIAGSVGMHGTSFDGPLDASMVQVGGSLSMTSGCPEQNYPERGRKPNQCENRWASCYDRR